MGNKVLILEDAIVTVKRQLHVSWLICKGVHCFHFRPAPAHRTRPIQNMRLNSSLRTVLSCKTSHPPLPSCNAHALLTCASLPLTATHCCHYRPAHELQMRPIQNTS